MNALQNAAIEICFTQRKSYQTSRLGYGHKKRHRGNTDVKTPELSAKELYCCQVATD